MDRSFFEAPVAVPKLSGFDKSFQNLYTGKVGTLIPALCDEVIPGSIIDLDMAASVSLPPLASDTFMRCSLKIEAFFVPMRLLFGGFEHFFVGDEFEVFAGNDTYNDVTITSLPSFSLVSSNDGDSSPRFEGLDVRGLFGANTLLDYLGFKTVARNFTLVPNEVNHVNSTFSLMPLLCYHKVWSDWYRSSLIQRDCFCPLDPTVDFETSPIVASLPYYIGSEGLNFVDIATLIDGDDVPSGSSLHSLIHSVYDLADDVDIFQLRQRNFGFDFFTCATPSPQNGTPASVTLDPTSLSTLGKGFTISQLRSMNSLQQFRERNNLAGDRYVDRLYAQYGVRPSDGIAQRVLCIGSADLEVYSKGVYSNNNDGGSASQNPFGGTLGSRGGSAFASSPGAINLCHGFKVAEPGYIMVMTSLVPRVTYAMGIDSKFTRYVKNNSIGEMANPILQNIGPEPIYVRELTADLASDDIFGYTDRYGHFKNKFDELHGLVRDGESLASFALQRFLDASSDPRIDSEFLQIPTDYMDNVTAVESTLSDYGYWVDSYFKYRVSMPLAKYSLPSLQDPAYEHGKTLVIRRGGFRF